MRAPIATSPGTSPDISSDISSRASSRPQPQRASFAWSCLGWGAAALMLIALFGALKLAVPLHRDTATFLWAATQLDQGATLYVDVWDVKQPGMFLFAWAAGRLFGFTPQGLHLLELLWHLTFAVTAIVALRPLLRHPWLAAMAPATFLISYYIYAEPHQQTQLEVLVSLPLFIVAWLSTIGWRSNGSRVAGFVAAGLAAGIATAFKHVLAPIPVAFLIAASVGAFRYGDVLGVPLARRGRLVVQLMWLPFAAGVIAVWGGIAFAFWRLGALDAFLSTTFVYPLDALGEVSRAPLGRLVLAVSVFVVAMAPWLFYAGWGMFVQLWRGGPALFGRMVLWLVMAAIVILMQKSSWWAYHMLLLYAPAGVLAARGLDLIVERLTDAVNGPGRQGQATRRSGALAISALLILPPLLAVGYPAAETARKVVDGLTGPDSSLESYQRQVSSDYAQAAEAADFLKAHPGDGPVYVFGDNTILLLSGRHSALPEQGSAWDFYLPEQWHRLPADLRATAPDWVFLEDHSRALVERKSPETVALLQDGYRVAWETPYGRWFERRDAGQQQTPGSDGSDASR